MRILFIKPSSFGDIVHGLQLAESLKQDLPGLHISWVARDVFAPLVRACSTIDVVFEFQRKDGIGGFLRLVREVRGQDFDWVVDLQGLFRTGLLTALSKGCQKVGRADAREFAGLFYRSRPALPENQPAHALDILLQFRRFFGLNLELTGQLRFESDLPDGFPAIVDGSTVLMFPESRRVEKQWPLFQELTRQLLEQEGDCRVIWGGNGDVDAPEGCPSDRFINLSGKTSLDCLPAMVAAADFILSNDSGPMHLAAAMRRPVLALFGPTDPQRFGPYPVSGGLSKVLAAPDGNLARLGINVVMEAVLSMSNAC